MVTAVYGGQIITQVEELWREIETSAAKGWTLVPWRRPECHESYRGKAWGCGAAVFV